ncbi:MAG: flavin monoamine oxidase family protein, partial [Acidimicrobiales bacterium]
IEFGAELIGWNHAVWRGLAEAFGLKFSMLDGAGPPGPWDLAESKPVVRGDAASELRAGVDQVVERLAELSTRVNPYRPWEPVVDGHALDDPAHWDGLSLAAWLREQNLTDDVRAAVEIEFGNDNVRPLADQSMLGVLAQIAGGGCYRFDEDTEVMRCAEGNQALADCLVRGASQATHMLHAEVQEVTVEDGQSATGRRPVRVTVRRHGAIGGDPEVHSDDADFVVVAVPPSIYGSLSFERLAITNLIGEDYSISLGPAVKHFAVLPAPQWGDNGSDGMSSLVGETWSGVDVPSAGAYELSLFAGGDAALRAMDAQTPDDPFADRFYAPAIERLFPAYAPDRTDFMAWPNEPYIRCGYSSLGVKELVKAKRLSEPFEGRVVFAGEHTCPAFYGYMEGALESGLLAVHQILQQQGFYAPRPDAQTVTTILDALQAARNAGTQWGPEPPPQAS